MPNSVRAYVALGSNLGDRVGALVQARDALDHGPDTRVVAASRIWETTPVGPPGQGRYLNAVVALETRLGARPLLDRLLDLERAVGRDRVAESARWGPRRLDLDLLLFGAEQIDEPGLLVPHPRLHERVFVLAPLAEIAADLRHPVLGEPVATLLAHCRADDDARPWPHVVGWGAPPERDGQTGSASIEGAPSTGR